MLTAAAPPDSLAPLSLALLDTSMNACDQEGDWSSKFTDLLSRASTHWLRSEAREGSAPHLRLPDSGRSAASPSETHQERR